MADALTTNLLPIVLGGLMAVVVITVLVRSARGARSVAQARNDAARQEALFKASFPELQPYLHPGNVLQFVTAWRARKPASGRYEWKNPPGFALPRARLEPLEKGTQVQLLDAAGVPAAQFLLQPHPEGGVIRIGPGKLTVNLRDAAVRYWHPQREFKWSRLKGWRVLTALADQPIDSTDRGMSFSSDSSPSTTTTAAGAAAAAAVVGAGGTFDGGGSSSSWDDASGASGPSDAPDTADASESRTAY